MSTYPQEGRQWTLDASFAQRLLYQGWYLLLACEMCEDDLPDLVRQEAADLRAMTEEYCGQCSPLPARESC